jgi:hypothetical protein
MLTLEVHGQLINWPSDFALMMMKYYRNHGVPFRVHRNSANAGIDLTAKGNALQKHSS